MRMMVIEVMDVVKVVLWVLQKNHFWNIMQKLMLIVDINSSNIITIITPITITIITINIRIKVQSANDQKKRRRRRIRN